MDAKEGEGSYKLLLQSVNPSNAAEVQKVIQKLLGVGPGQANDIVESAPIILLDGIAEREKADAIREKFRDALELGAQIAVSDENLERMPRLRWPEEPEIAREASQEVPQNNREVVTLAKYNFVIDQRNVFRCPHCNSLFALTELTPEQAQEAAAQAQIAQRLRKQEAVPEPAAPARQAASRAAVRGQNVQEVEPIRSSGAPGVQLSTPDVDVIDLAAFEKGLSTDGQERAVPDLALPPDLQAAPAGGQVEDFFQELESLPAEDGVKDASPSGQPSVKAAKKESELEELAPEEAMRFFEGRRARTDERKEEESEGKEEKRKFVAPRRGAARRRMQHIRGRQEERAAGRRRPEPEEEDEEELPREVQHTEGFYGVTLSRIGSRDRKDKAAKLISELTGMHPDEARDMCEGTFVNVLRGISEEEANQIVEKFKTIGVLARTTVQKRKMRRSGKMQRGRG